MLTLRGAFFTVETNKVSWLVAYSAAAQAQITISPRYSTALSQSLFLSPCSDDKALTLFL